MASDLCVGTQGIILRKGFHQAVLLPRAAEVGTWDARDALTYPDGADVLEVFSADVFRES